MDHHTMMRHEDGVTMIEVVVSLTLMAVLMTIFTTAVLDVYRNVNQTESISTSASTLNNVFLRLDKEVRYASGISQPVRLSDGTWYVEYLNTSQGTEICTQLRLTPTNLLQRRTWNRGQTSFAPSGWQLLASDVTKVNATGPSTGPSANPSTGPSASPGFANNDPFVFSAPDPARASGALAGSNFQQLTITLAALGRNGLQIAASSITFAALNTSLAMTSAGVCTEGRPPQ
jgi:prepilin-type N-terminal cleavage/methylation domain-containing protein